MGVKSLWSLLTPVGRPVMLETMEGKSMAIDSSIWMYQFQATMRDKDGRGLVNAHVLGFLRRICKLLYYGIKPVFVFDGGAPTLKRQTIGDRKRKKQGAAETHAKLAERLLAAQLRREAVIQAQKDSGKGKSKIPQGSVPIDENTVFLEDLEPSALITPLKNKSKAEETPSSKKKNRWQDHDPYRLPEVDMNAAVARATRASAPDPRLATEEELRAFIEEMRPEDLDVTSPAFKELPTEVQYEIIGDLRLKSRQTSYKRLQSMIRGSRDSLDFSKAQIMNLKQRNALTQRLLETTDSIGQAHISIPIRIASERNREYLLMKNEGEGIGWVLGIRDEGTRAKPIEIDQEDDIDREKEEQSDESDFEMEEVAIPAVSVPDPDYREYKRELALQGVAHRQVSDKSRTFKRSTAPIPKTPSKSKRTPLFELDDDDESALIQRERELMDDDENDVDMVIAMQASLEDQEEEELRRAIKASRSESSHKIGESSKTPHNGLTLQTTLAVSESDSDEDSYLPHLSRLDTALSIANIGSSSSGRIRGSPTSARKSEYFFGSPTLLRPSPKSIPNQDAKTPPSNQLGMDSDNDDMEEVVVLNTTVPSSSALRSEVSPGRHNGSDLGRGQGSASAQGGSLGRSTAFTGDTKSPYIIGSRAPQDWHIDEPEIQITSFSMPGLDPHDFIPAVDSDHEMEKVILHAAPDLAGLEPIATLDPHTSRRVPLYDTVATTPETPPEKPLTTPVSSSPLLPEKSALHRDVKHPDNMDSATPANRSSSDPVAISYSRGSSRSPSPEAEESHNAAATAEDWDAAQEMDPVQEEGEFARFVSQVKGKDLDSVRKDIDEEIRILHQQRKVAMRDSEDVTQQMTSQIMTMLRLFGIPYITSPMEAEAQCAELVSLGLVDGIITDDSDVFLFGGLRVFKNMFNQSKTVECFLLSDLDRELGLDRDKLIRLAYLLGSDYVEGLPGVGPVVAMELLTEFSGNDGLHKFREWWQKVQTGRDKETDIVSSFRKRFKKRFKELYLAQEWPNPAVRDAYYHPAVDSSEEPFKWGLPDLDALRNFFQEELGWNANKVDELLLPIIQRMGRRGQANALNKQGNLTDYFDISLGTGAFEPRKRQAYSSKRLQELVSEHRKKRRRENAGLDDGDTQGEGDDGDGEATSSLTPAKKTKAPSKRKTKTKLSEEGSQEQPAKGGRGNKSGIRGGRRGRGRGASKSTSNKSRSEAPPSSSDEEFRGGSEKGGLLEAPEVPSLGVRLRSRPKPAYTGSKTAKEVKENSGKSSDSEDDN